MEKLLAIASLGQRAYGRWLFQRLLLGIIVVVGLTIIIAIMVSATLLGGLVAAYFSLLQYGVEPPTAMIIIAMSVILIIGTLVTLMMICLHHLRQIPVTLLKRSPLTSRAMDAVNAFSDGFRATN